MTERPDYYQLLGLDAAAGAEAIKKAYRACARAHHPDRHPGDAEAAERFKGVSEAYAVLSDPARRQQYDLLRQPPFNTFGHFPTTFAPASHPEPRRPHVHLRLSFEQGLRGGKAKLRLPDGRAAQVPVPKGVRNGQTVRLRNTPAPATPDELLVTFHVAPSDRFRRKGDHLLLTETVSVFDALLGTTRNVENAYGQSVPVTIPPGTQPGERLRVRGQGVATDRGTGDLFVQVAVSIPRDLTEVQRQHLRAAFEEADAR